MQKMNLVFDLDKLEAGDILLTGGKGKISTAITVSTFSRFSHAALFVDSTGFIEANLDGVTVNNPQRELFEPNDVVTLLRLKNTASPEVITQICYYAYSRVGTEYSKIEASKTLVKGLGRHEANRQFCSRLVAEAYAHAGLNLVANPAFCSPKDLASSPLLSQIDGFLRPAKPAEIKFALSSSPLEEQAEIISCFLEDVRSVCNQDIQSMGQVIYLLIENSDLDEKVTNLLKASGYLEIYQMDEDNNPWRYGLCSYAEAGFFGESAKERAKKDYQLAVKLITKFEGELEVVKTLKAQYHRKYFDTLDELYTNLVEWQNTALRVAKENA